MLKRSSNNENLDQIMYTFYVFMPSLNTNKHFTVVLQIRQNKTNKVVSTWKRKQTV